MTAIHMSAAPRRTGAEGLVKPTARIDKVIDDFADLERRFEEQGVKLEQQQVELGRCQSELSAVTAANRALQAENLELRSRVTKLEAGNVANQPKLDAHEEVLACLSTKGMAEQKAVLASLLNGVGACEGVGNRLAALEDNRDAMMARCLANKLGLRTEKDCENSAETLNKVSDAYMALPAEIAMLATKLSDMTKGFEEFKQATEQRQREVAASARALAAQPAAVAPSWAHVVRQPGGSTNSNPATQQQQAPTSYQFCAMASLPADTVKEALVQTAKCNTDAVVVRAQQGQGDGRLPRGQQPPQQGTSGEGADQQATAVDSQQPAQPGRTRFVVTVPSRDLRDYFLCNGGARQTLRDLKVSIDDYLSPQEVRARNARRPEMARLQAQGKTVAFRGAELWWCQPHPRGLKDRWGRVRGTWKKVEEGELVGHK